LDINVKYRSFVFARCDNDVRQTISFQNASCRAVGRCKEVISL